MTLASAFEKGKNLGVLTQAWLQEAKAHLKSSLTDTEFKLQVSSAASMVAPAALVAGVIRNSGLEGQKSPIRVLLIGSDPLIRLDHSKWASMAGDMLGSPGSVEVLLTRDEDARSEFSTLAEAIGLKPCGVLLHEDAAAGVGQPVDLAIWVHPAGESYDPEEQLNTNTALAMASARGVPTYTSSFNEVDLHAQNYLLHPMGWCSVPLGGVIERGAKAINRFAISTTDLGIEGGWSAILSKLEPIDVTVTPAEIALVRTAMRLVCAEGALQSSWTLGQRINGVAFNSIIPVGLLGNMAVDPESGHVLSHDEDTKELRVIGHLWQKALSAMPDSKRELLLWACEVKLSFQADLPKEDVRRRESIETLQSGFEAGVLSAGVALARCFESSKADASSIKAEHWYRAVGDRHPISAYSLAYLAIEAGDRDAIERFLRSAAGFGYPVAMTDLGKWLYSNERTAEGLNYLVQAAGLRDPEANYELGEVAAKSGELQQAIEYLRQAWRYGHVEAAALAAEVACYMLEHGIGKRSLIKRELREVLAYQKKLDRRLDAEKV